MNDIVESQTKNEYEKGNRPPTRYIITEAPVRLRTPRGVRRYPEGTMFRALSFVPVNEEHKLPEGEKLGELVSTKEKPLFSTVSVAWVGSSEKRILWESEPTLRRKVARAESRAAMLRAIAVGAAAGTAVAILQGLLPAISDWVSHWGGIIIGLVVGVTDASP